MSIKNRVAEYRKLNQLTQKELGNKVEVSRQTINAIENNKYSPSLELAFKISKVFKVSIEEIFIQ